MRAVVQRVRSASVTVRHHLQAQPVVASGPGSRCRSSIVLAALFDRLVARQEGRVNQAPSRHAGSCALTQVDGTVVSSIGPGLLCLVGVRAEDTEKDAEYVCKKILKTRAFSSKDGERYWDEDVVTRGYEILLVSQFTLYGRLKKPRPDFSKAMPPQDAREFYSSFVQRVQSEYQEDKVKDGIFGALMDVALVNDGPVTFIIDSQDY